MRLNSKALAVIIAVIFFGGIALSSALGIWSTEGGGGAGQGRGAQAGTVAEAEIRGRTTFQELLEMGISTDAIEEIIGGPLPQPSVRVRDYCIERGLDFETVKGLLEEAYQKRSP